MKKNKKQMIISLTAIVLIVVLIVSATYAYFAAQYGEASSTDITVTTSTVDNLTFETGDAISISATQSNFTEGSGNQSGSTYASATLVANNDTNEATAYYSIYLNIPTNEFEYTTSDSAAEVLLVITDKDGNIITELENLEYVTITDGQGNALSGFDITGHTGSLAVTEFQEIISTGTITETWNFSVTLVNLDTDQSANAGKSLNAYLTIMKSGNTLQAYSSGSEIWAYKSSITKIIFDDTGTTINDYEEVFDLSEADNNTIKAYLVSNDSSSLSMLSNSLIENKVNYLSNEIAETNTYTVYIVSDLPILGNENMRLWFYNFTALESIEGLDKLITSNVTNMYALFAYSYKLTSLDLSSWDTSNVTNMAYMFYGMNALSYLNVTSFDTSNVETMAGMFYVSSTGWGNLTELDVSNFNTSKVTDMSLMFNHQKYLTEIDVSNWDTSNVTTMQGMFQRCDGLISLDLSNWNTSKVTDMSYFLGGTNLDETFASGYGNGKALTSIKFGSGWDTSNVTTMAGMFTYLVNLTEIDLSGWNTSKVTNMSGMFLGCSGLTSLDLSSFDTSKVTNMNSMFGGSYDENQIMSLTSITFGSKWDTSNVTDMGYMFCNCAYLTTLDLSTWDTSSLENAEKLFYNTSSLTSLNLSNASFTAVTTYDEMFYNNSSSINVTVKDSTAYDFITARLSEYNGGTVVIA